MASKALTNKCIGDVDAWMDENYILSLFANVSAVQAKIIRDKSSGVPAGYGFVEFSNHQSAKVCIRMALEAGSLESISIHFPGA